MFDAEVGASVRGKSNSDSFSPGVVARVKITTFGRDCLVGFGTVGTVNVSSEAIGCPEWTSFN